MLVQRAAVTLTLGPLVLFLIYLGGWFFTVPVIIIMLVACRELKRMFAPLDADISLSIVMPAVAAHYLIAQLLFVSASTSSVLMLVFFLSLLAALLVALRNYENGNRHASASLFGTMTGIIFLGWLGSHAILLRNIDPARGSEYWQWTAIVIIATWIADTGAFLVGTYVAGKGIFGRHPLTPRLSPKKTIEGYIGGILIGATTASIIGLLIFQLPTATVIALSVLAAALGTAGDLAISMFKRESGVKDSGSLFPGHGGALDRIDSLLWTVAFSYYFLYFFG